MHSGNSLSPNNPAFSISIGIASLVLEGRPLCDDEYVREPTIESTTPTTVDDEYLATPTSSSQTQLVSLQQSGPFPFRQDSVQHIQRLRQKLQLLRSSPSTSRDHVEQLVSIVSGSTASGYDSDDELEMIYKKRQQLHEGNVLSSLQSLATTCLQTTPRSFNKTHGLLRTVEAWTASGRITGQSHEIATKLTSKFADNIKKKTQDKGAKQHGPHCEQFLRKIGLIRDVNAAPDVPDFDEHYCTESNENCFRWQIHYKQLVSVFSRGDPICIEVYLGPENHVILLEQWIIQQCVGTSHITMTLQSLCSAIRSQLYFSQITAWTDLLRSCSQYDTDIKNNPRLKLSSSHKLKLDILYRIRPYDSTSCFNNKPNVHHFPDTKISDNLAIKVSLKSLPRLQTIPKLQDEVRMPTFSSNVGCGSGSSGGSGSGIGIGECSNSQAMIVDDRLNHPCMEKGKHRCGFDEESVADEMEATPTLSVSHRDRQLLKYKKRIMKRDKKKRNDNSLSDETVSCQQHHCNDSEHSANIDHPQLYEPTSINSIRPPLYSTIQQLTIKSTQTCSVEMRSVCTQTDMDLESFPNCDFCGIEMQYICWNCDNNLFVQPNETSPKRLGGADLLLQAIQRTPSVKQSNLWKKKQQQQQKQEHQRNCEKSKSQKISQSLCSVSTDNNSSNSSGSGSECDKDNMLCDRKSICDNSNLDLSDCRLCKRQKTVHNYVKNSDRGSPTPSVCSKISNKSLAAASTIDDESKTNSECGVGYYRRTMSDSLDVTSGNNSGDINKLPHPTVVPDAELKFYRRAYSEDVLAACVCDDVDNAVTDLDKGKTIPKLELPLSEGLGCNIEEQMRTPTTSRQAALLLNPKNTKINPLYVSCSEDIDMTRPKLAIGKEIPKVNLSKVFNISPASPWDQRYVMEKRDFPTSSPISINGYNSFTFEYTSPTSSIGSSVAGHGAIVHKSNSAPTFPNSPVLSPRFLKTAAVHKRRSRHLSDRSSERSSIGSDEQFSDEEYGFGLDNTYSPVISPTKTTGPLKSFSRSHLFAKKALLGSYEEALLQRCFMPKCQIYGFKILLGASGGFCPTQMTLTSSTYFYELKGQSLSTPYTCEIRLPRKGYSVPRLGTVQATLLNPMGMVVRMFVVPYDFRDMPNMSQTFIRQRVLAFDESANTEKDVSNLTAAEQMKILRYAIHLRFQTSRSGRLALHTDIRMLINRRTDCDTAAAHAKDALESPNELKIVTIVPGNPKFSTRLDKI